MGGEERDIRMNHGAAYPWETESFTLLQHTFHLVFGIVLLVLPVFHQLANLVGWSVKLVKD